MNSKSLKTLNSPRLAIMSALSLLLLLAITQTASAQQNVTWTNAVGVSVSGNTLTKTAADDWSNAGAISTQSIASGDGYVEFTASETSTYRMIGLSHGDTNQHYADIDYALYLGGGGGLYIYEAGTYIGSFASYVTGNVLRVEILGSVIYYKRNGTVIYSHSVSPTYPLLVDTSLYNNGSTISNVVIAGGGTPNNPPSVSLTAPGNNATFGTGSNILLTATATDTDGTVSKVEFYQGATKLGESLNSPEGVRSFV